MADEIPIDPRLPEGRGNGCWMLVAPIVMVMGIVTAYGVLIVAGFIGRAPDGNVVRMEFVGCEAALTTVQARVAEMGLGDPSFSTVDGGFTVTAQLPAEVDRAGQIPFALAKTGSLEILDLGSRKVVATQANVTYSTVRLDWSGTPSTTIELDEAGAAALKAQMLSDKDGHIAVEIDGKQLSTYPNLQPLADGKLQIETNADQLEEATAQVAEWALLLNNGALPCDVSVKSIDVTVAAEPPPN